MTVITPQIISVYIRIISTNINSRLFTFVIAVLQLSFLIEWCSFYDEDDYHDDDDDDDDDDDRGNSRNRKHIGW